MKDEEYIKKLEDIIKQILKPMIQPLKDIPFNLVIKVLSGRKVIPFDINNPEHKKVLDILMEIGTIASSKINSQGIKRKRANEVGNDIENFVEEALKNKGIRAETPSTSSGKRKSTGYPDIIFYVDNKPYYLECKTYSKTTINSAQRTFYLSPSEEFKVIHDTIHFVISFEIFQDKDGSYKTNHFKILSLEDLSLDLKHEFNSNNKKLYSEENEAKILYSKNGTDQMK